MLSAARVSELHDAEAPRSQKKVLAETVAAYLRPAAKWIADYRDAFAKGRGTAANHLFYAGEAVMLAVLTT
jgi:hypothetical protein